MVKLILAILLLLPSLSYSECLQWILCPYQDENNGSRRLILPQGSQWEAIEVRGNKAVVCMLSVLSVPDRVAGGCTPLPAGAMKAHMVDPYEPQLDAATGKVVLRDGTGGRPTVVRPFNEQALNKKFAHDSEFAGGFPRP